MEGKKVVFLVRSSHVQGGTTVNDSLETKVGAIVARLLAWIKEILSDAMFMDDAESAAEMEVRVREGGRVLLAQLLELAFNIAAEKKAAASRRCACQKLRRHKGKRERTVVSSLGPIKLRGILFACATCKLTVGPFEQLTAGFFTVEMERLLALMGTALASFEKAKEFAARALGVKVSADSVAKVCRRLGRGAAAAATCEPFENGDSIEASMDGTMVNTRGEGWRELKVFRFEGERGVAGGASLERVDRFEEEVARTARALNVEAKRTVFVTDAAAWIDRIVRERFPLALHIVDLWHACQHIHAAAKAMFGDVSEEAKTWASRWCGDLRARGAGPVMLALTRLIGVTHNSEHQNELRKLWRFLRNNESKMDYPKYEEAGHSISSGSMESQCKQVGSRLKGPGMRWNSSNVDPMATLVSHWQLGTWDCVCKAAA